MITVWEADGKEVRATSLDKWKKSTCWIDCTQLSHAEQEKLAHTVGIPVANLREAVDAHKRPRLVSTSKYTLIVFRGVNKDSSHVHTVVLALFIFRNFVLSIHEGPVRGLETVRGFSRERKAELCLKPILFAYHILDASVAGFFSVMEEIEREVDTVENQVLKEPSKIAMQRLFLVKRRLIYIQKALATDRDVIASVERLQDHEVREHFRDLYQDVAQLFDMVMTYRDVLTSVMDMYVSSMSNNLNKVMKTLTILSAYVMVPTLISGIYGMNFRFMPELLWQWGYLFSLTLMALSIVVFYIYFKRKGWLTWP
ncbi:MAG TPA: magnesium/cobalt transporter CorA [Candidatus Nanoarchaeia archaeon]|nr:magnesium/cobalt transporter CorA [Candidatus Nanoarchaeia archaeon]